MERVKNLWFMKLVERLIDLNKEIKTKQEHFKKTILGNVVFVKELEKLFEKAIDRKKAEKAGLEQLKQFKTDTLEKFKNKIKAKREALEN